MWLKYQIVNQILKRAMCHNETFQEHYHYHYYSARNIKMIGYLVGNFNGYIDYCSWFFTFNQVVYVGLSSNRS